MPAGPVAPSYLIGPTSRMTDCWDPSPEVKILPARKTTPGRLDASIAEGARVAVGEAPAGRLKRIFARPAAPFDLPADDLHIDFRAHAPGNWAHMLTNHLPLLMKLCAALDLAPEKRPRIILPADAPGYITRLLDLFELQTIRIDGPARGRTIEFSMKPWISIRGTRGAIVGERFAEWPAFHRIEANAAAKIPKLLIARKGARAIANEDQIGGYFEERGFRKIYMEEHSPLDQMTFLIYAEEIAAMHGAGLGPLLYRAAFGRRPFKMIELFGPGYVTDAFRVIAQHVGGDWIGVHGKIAAEMVRHLNAETDDARAYTNAGAEFDLAAIDLAYEMMTGRRSIETPAGFS